MHPFLLHRVHGDDIITFYGSSFMFPINTVRGFCVSRLEITSAIGEK